MLIINFGVPNQFANGPIKSSLIEALSNTLFWGAIIVACFVIFLGFLFEKKKICGNSWEKPLVKIILYIGLPALILKSFMIDLNLQTFQNMIALLILGILFYWLMSLVNRLFFYKKNRDLQDAYSMAVTFSSAIYFGLPMALALATNEEGRNQILATQNMFNIGYWVFMCSYALYIFRHQNLVPSPSGSGKEIKIKSRSNYQEFFKNDLKPLILSPIIIALFLGLILWLMQLIPGIKIIRVTKHGWNTVPDDNVYSITRLDALIPGFSQATTILGALPTPLAWLAVGAMIGKNDLKETFANREIWYATGLRMIVQPLIISALLVAVAAIGKGTGAFHLGNMSLIVIILMVASPTATTIASYAITYEKGAKVCSQICTLSTIIAVVTMPIWVIIAITLGQTTIFTQL